MGVGTLSQILSLGVGVIMNLNPDFVQKAEFDPLRLGRREHSQLRVMCNNSLMFDSIGHLSTCELYEDSISLSRSLI